MTIHVSGVTFSSISIDSGSSNADFYTNDSTLVINGTSSGGGGGSGTISVWATSGTTHTLLGNFTITDTGQFQFDAANTSLPSGSFTLEAFDGSHATYPGSGAVGTHALTIDTSNPTEMVPGGQTDHTTAPQNGDLVFSTANGNAITVGDNNSDTLSVTMSVGSGTFTALATTGVSISNNGSGNVTLTGSAADINTALNGATYHTTSTNQTVGNVDDTLAISVTDQAGNSSSSSVNIDVVCFMAGTMIRTPDGEAAIETLKIGDLVLSSDGRAIPIEWVGRQTVSTIFGNKERILPIRIKADALGENVPSRDLLVSPDHALLVEGALIQAGALVNGSSIVRERRVPTIFTYYHVEVDDHSLILAENTPAETFVDNVDRLHFDNWAEHEALFPNGKYVEELPYPRAKSHRQVPIRIRVMLGARAQSMEAVESSAVA